MKLHQVSLSKGRAEPPSSLARDQRLARCRSAFAYPLERAIFVHMGKHYAGGIYVLAASKDGKTDYWVAATKPKEATVAVQLALGPAWKVRLTDRRLTPNQVAELQLRPDEVRRLIPLPYKPPPRSGSYKLSGHSCWDGVAAG
jgi:hypothetical protein